MDIDKYRQSFYGKVFNNLQILEFLRMQNEQAIYKVKCHCGNIFENTIGRIKSGNTKSCGCFKKNISENIIKNMVGKKFGTITVINYVKSENKKTYYLTRCDCGKEKIRSKDVLVYNKIKSCGCERDKEASKRFQTHGYSKNYKMRKEFQAWASILERCLNKNCRFYHRYGGRGITVCDEWKHSFTNFINDMGDAPGKEYSIDRIDPDGNYEPKNCRWTTRDIQNINKAKKEGTRSRFKGVYPCNGNKTNPWIAVIKRKGITKHLGSFKTEEDAALAFNKAALEYSSETIFLNKV